jgi:hypothetical protein
MRLTTLRRLEAAFPFARSIDLILEDEDGSFLAEMVLPVKHGESTVQLYRYPQEIVRRVPPGPVAVNFPHEDKLRWRHPNKLNFGGAGRWGFWTAWDGVASLEEVEELVVKRVKRDHRMGAEDG